MDDLLTAADKNVKELMLGFPVTDFGPGERRVVRVAAPHLFRPERLLISSIIGVDFLVHSLTSVGVAHVRAPDGVPAVVFSEMAFGVRMKMTACPRGGELLLDVSCTSARGASPRKFYASVIGPYVLADGETDEVATEKTEEVRS